MPRLAAMPPLRNCLAGVLVACLCLDGAAAFFQHGSLLMPRSMGRHQAALAASPPTRAVTAERRRMTALGLLLQTDKMEEQDEMWQRKQEMGNRQARANNDVAAELERLGVDLNNLPAADEADEGAAEEQSEEERRAAKMKAAMALAAKARGKAAAAPAEDEISEGETKKTTSGIGGAWTGADAASAGEHKPKVATWGVFERPADISKAYGGGRKIGVDGYTPPEEEVKEKEAKTKELLSAYRKSVGVDRELEDQHRAEIEEALKEHEALMRNIAPARAVDVLEKVLAYTSPKSSLGGKVYLNLAMGYEAQGERAKAKKTYTKLLGNADRSINKKARELLFGFEAMEFMNVNATYSKNERKVMNFELPDFTRGMKKKYDMSYYDKEAMEQRARMAAADTRIAEKKKAGGAQFSASNEKVPDEAQSIAVQLEKGASVGDGAAVDIIVIGSGIAGLSAAALLSKYGYSTLVLESHNHAGGAAHCFEIKGKGGTYKFDSGPSLFSGLSVSDDEMKGNERCVNPLKQVLDAVGEEVPCINYDTWGVCLPEGDFPATVGSEPFQADLRMLFPGQEGEDAVQEWKDLQEYMTPLAAASVALPPAAIRFDVGLLATLFRYLPQMLKYPNVGQLLGPYSNILDKVLPKNGKKGNRFIRNWLDMLSFLLSGLPADGTITAEVAFMFAEWYRPGVRLDYPEGGSEGIVDALIRGIEKNGGKVVLKQHVQNIIVEGGEAAGVVLKGGQKIKARKAVISNAAMRNTARLLGPDDVPESWRSEVEETPECPSFMHLHCGFSAQGLKEAMGGKELQCHYMVVNDWDKGVDSEQNLVLVSIPSVLDPSLAPEGMHTVHAYTPATEPYDLWKGLDRSSPEYEALKEERSQVLWKAIERAIPDIKQRADVAIVGTPLTHERFLRRHRGSYGPAIRAGTAVFPGPLTPIKNLLLCGDSVFPGIGMPAVAASGMVAAHTLGLETLGKHQKLLDELSV